jgi:hypothetical protein
MKRQTTEERSVTETTESSDYDSWETCEDDSSGRDEDDDGTNSSSSSVVTGEDRAKVGPDIVPKTIPAPDGTYKVVCLSFLDESATAPIASQVFDESWRMLAPGGLLYVVDNRAVVCKVPKMRQMLSRVIQPTATLQSHDVRTREIVKANGFDTDTSFLEGNKVVRWAATKPMK